MRIAGVRDPDDDRPAADVAQERGIRLSPFRGGPRAGEKWASFAARVGITQRETARAWWETNQILDEARGLPRDPEPDWTNEAAVRTWDRAPWLSPSEHQALRAGEQLGGPLATRLAQWERLPRLVEQAIATAPIATTIEDLVGRADIVEAAVAGRGGLGHTSLPMQATTVRKYLRKGGELAWEGGRLVLRFGTKVYPLARAVHDTIDLYQTLEQLLPDIDPEYLPVRIYQPSSNTYVYRWPNGEETAAPPP